MDEGWITAEQMRAALDAAGAQITCHQIERWRRTGLLPRPRQIGHGRGLGSHCVAPLESVAQAQEIVRLYGLREKRDWVGWQLWLRGFQVDERYWREPIESARNALRQVREAGTKLGRHIGMDAGSIKAAALAMTRGTVLYAPIAKLHPEMVETVIGYGIEIVNGKFAGFSLDGNAKPNRKDLNAAIETIGATAAERHKIAGDGIDFSKLIEPALQEISQALSRIMRQQKIGEPSLEARREFLVGLELGIELNRHFKADFGRNAFGLGKFSRIAENPAINLQATMLYIWAEYREISKVKLAFPEIASMRNSAIQLAGKSGDM